MARNLIYNQTSRTLSATNYATLQGYNQYTIAYISFPHHYSSNSVM